MKVDSSLSILALNFALISAILGQKFDFQDGIKHDETCGTDGQMYWSSEGSVVLTPGDFIGFQPKVLIHALQEVCAVDLTTCPPEQPPTSPQSCFCKSKHGDRYLIHVGSWTSVSQSGMTLQAVVPGYGPLKNISGAATIGTLPYKTDKLPPVNATYSIEHGAPRDLLYSQNVSVCQRKETFLEICVKNGRPEATLQMEVDNQTTVVTGGRCITHKVTYGLTKTVQFEYKEPNRCTQIHHIHIKEDIQACIQPTISTTPSLDSSPTTATSTDGESTTVAGTTMALNTTQAIPATITFEVATTFNVGTTTVETVTTSDMATMTIPTTTTQIAGLCPSTERSVKTLPSGLEVLTDDVSFNQSWTVFQRRVSNEVEFYRPWVDYEAGFGNVTNSFWLGLREIHRMCNRERPCELLIHLSYGQQPLSVPRRADGCYHARYSEFWLGDAVENYTLTVNGYTGDAGDSLQLRNKLKNVINDQQQFSTFDRDNDMEVHGNCAQGHHGAWWYNRCHASNLNSRLGHRGNASGAMWGTLTSWSDSVSFSEMKMKPRT